MPKSFSFYYFPMVSQQPNRAKERKLNMRERERENGTMVAREIEEATARWDGNKLIVLVRALSLSNRLQQ